MRSLLAFLAASAACPGCVEAAEVFHRRQYYNNTAPAIHKTPPTHTVTSQPAPSRIPIPPDQYSPSLVLTRPLPALTSSRNPLVTAASHPNLADCTVNVPRAGLDWWYSTSIHYYYLTLDLDVAEPESPTPAYATGWSATYGPRPNITSIFQHTHATYTTTVTYNTRQNKTVTSGYYVSLYPPVAPVTTTVIETGYVSGIPSTTSFSSRPINAPASLSASLGPATTAIASSPGSTFTSDTAFLRFSQYEISRVTPRLSSGRVVLLTRVQTFNLTATQGYPLASYNFNGVLSASGTLPTAFGKAIPQSTCVLGTWKARPTVIVVVVLDYAVAAALALTYSAPAFASAETFASTPAPVTAAVASAPRVAGSNRPVFGTFSSAITESLPIICQGPGCTIVGGIAAPGAPQTDPNGLSVPGSVVVANPGAPATSQPAVQTPAVVVPPSNAPASVGGVATTQVPPQTPAPNPANQPSPAAQTGEPGDLGDLAPILSALGFPKSAGQVPFISAQGPITPAPSPQATGAHLAQPVIVVNGETLTANANHAYTVNGQLLTAGGQVTGTGGQMVSLAPNGQSVVIGGQTQVLPNAITAAPQPTLGVGTPASIMGSNSVHVVDGQSLTPGGVVVVDGMTTNQGPDAATALAGITAPGTIASAAAAASTTGGLGSYIMGGLGGAQNTISPAGGLSARPKDNEAEAALPIRHTSVALGLFVAGLAILF